MVKREPGDRGELLDLAAVATGGDEFLLVSARPLIDGSRGARRSGPSSLPEGEGRGEGVTASRLFAEAPSPNLP